MDFGRTVRRTLKAVLSWFIVTLSLTGCGERPGEERTGPRPPRHVLLLTIDALRSDYLSANGYDRPTTPFIDSLLADGVQFPNAWVTVPRTTPSLASLLAGAYPHTTGVRTLYDRLAPEAVTLPQFFKANGFATVAVISNHVMTAERGLNRGFDVYDTADDSRDAAMTNEAVFRHIAGRRREDPLFLRVHYIDPHVPYLPPPELAGRFDPGYEGRYRLSFGTVKGGVGDRAYPEDLPKARAVFGNPLPEEVNAHIRRLYAADIRATDDAAGQLVERLHARLGDDWLIVLTADHGESLGEHGFYYDHGDYLYEPALRVPLAFIFPPGDPRARGRTVGDRVSLVDVMPTLVELFGLGVLPEAVRQVEGRSLVPFLEGGQMAPRAVFAECGMSFYPELIRRRVRFDVEGRFRAVALGAWKLIWTPGQSPGQEYELYDLAGDPGETRNLHAPGHGQGERLKALLRTWWRPAAHPRAPMSEEDARRLRSLGYLD
jgi:arylsulfatase A-like enzyme